MKNEIYDGYIIFNRPKHKYGLMARVSKSSPNLKAGEVAVKLRAELPEQLFQRPVLQANITVPVDAVQKSLINAQVQDNIQQIVKEAIGIDIAFTLKEVQEEKNNEPK